MTAYAYCTSREPARITVDCYNDRMQRQAILVDFLTRAFAGRHAVSSEKRVLVQMVEACRLDPGKSREGSQKRYYYCKCHRERDA